MEIDLNTGIIIISMFANSGILLAYFGSIEKRLCRIENKLFPINQGGIL